MSIEPRHGHTRLITEPFDQGQLHGLLNRVRDFGFELLAVEAMPAAPINSVVAQPIAAEAGPANPGAAGRPGAAGAQREIRDTVFISFNTVKTHSKSISRKLDVAIRADAVTRPRELPLVH